jgi:hypothetical protein
MGKEVKLTNDTALQTISQSFGQFADQLEKRASECRDAIDAGLHARSASAIRSMLSAYSAALEANRE